VKTRLLGSAVLGIAVLASGCDGRPIPILRDNRRVLDAILTAITLKNARLLEEDAELAKTRLAAGQLTADEYAGMEAVIRKARAGDWAGAEREGYAFREKHPFIKEGH
jgi:hypothetical protein